MDEQIQTISTSEAVTVSLNKVNILLRAMGEAPILKKQKYKLDGTKTLLEVEKFLKKSLGITDKAVYMYCGSGFSPTLDHVLQSLFDNFQVAVRNSSTDEEKLNECFGYIIFGMTNRCSL